MSYKKKLFFITLLLAHINFSILARDDINWIDYEDFGMNRGKFIQGKENIIVYKKNGDVSGIIEQPMPNFNGVTDWGFAVLWNDNQLLSSVQHVGLDKITMNKRFYRNDVKLYSNYSTNNMNALFSETYKNAYSTQAPNGHDYQIARLSTIVFDEKKQEAIKSEDLDRVKVGSLIARVGGGINNYASDDGEKNGAPYGYITGGLNKIVLTNGLSTSPHPTISIILEKKAKTPIDSGTKGGDSGSPVFFWDTIDKRWKLVAANAAGGGGNWGKWSFLKTNVKWVEDLTKSFDDKEISAQNISIENNSDNLKGKIKFDSETREYISKDTSLIREVKNQIFTNENSKITVNNDVNTSIGRFTFKGNSTIEGNGTLQTAGFIIEEGKTVTYKLKNSDDNVIRKIGKGTLKIESTGELKGELNVGDGLVELNSTSKPAFSKIRIATGDAVVKLVGDNQLNNDQVYFGRNGGTLDLNGKSVEFNNIYHMDNGAIIDNRNNSQKSTFTLKNTDKITYLGSFKGNIDVVYKGNNNSNLDLRGNSEIKGDLKLENSNISISGDNVLHGYLGTIGKDEFVKSSFKSNNLEAKNSTVTLNRASEIETNLNLDNSILNIKSTGNVLTDRLANYSNEDVEKVENEINNIRLKGNILFKNDNILNKDNFNVDIKNNNKAYIDSKISGIVKGIKNGQGDLYLNNENNDFNGSFKIEDGAIRVESNKSLGRETKYTINSKGVLGVNNSNTNLSDILKSVDTTSTGVLSLTNDIENLDSEISKYTTLFLGSNKNISIGNSNSKFNENITKLNIGGDKGTVTIKGLDLSSQITQFNAGNSYHRGTVIIEKLGENNKNLEINIGKLIDLEIKENTINKKLINLSYGSTIASRFQNSLKETSDGILILDAVNDVNLSELKNMAIGAQMGKTVELNKLSGIDSYNFSGSGLLNVNFNLENKDLVVDGQFLNGGIISINTENENYKGNITVQGNKIEDNKGDITLKLNSDYALGRSNIITLKHNATLDLNGKNTIFSNISDSNNTNITSFNGVSNVRFDNKENIEINSSLKGNINLILNSENNKSIELKNSQNNFTGIVNIIKGNFVHNNSNTITRNNKVYLNGKSSIEINNNFNTDIILNTVNEKAIDLTKNSNAVNIYNISLEKDAYSEGSLKTKSSNLGREKTITYENIKLANNTFNVKNQFFIINNTDVNSKGNLVIDDSVLRIVGQSNSLLSESRFNEITLKNSIIELRDYKFDTKYKERDIIVLGNSIIKNGGLGDSGGGAKTKFSNNIILNKGNNLKLLSENLHWQALNITSNLIGDGDVEVSTNDTGIYFHNNFKDFTGSLKINPNAILYLALSNENNDENYNVINYKIKSDKSGTKDIITDNENEVIFKDINEYNGRLVAKKGNIVLSGENALKTNATLYTQDANFDLRSDDYVETNSLNLNRWGRAFDKKSIIKSGSGEISFKDGIIVRDTDNFLIKDGTFTLNLSKDLVTLKTLKNDTAQLNDYITYEINENSNLKFKNLTDFSTTSNLTGAGNVIIDNNDKILSINSDKLNHLGDINILSGTFKVNLVEDKILQNLKGSGLLNLYTTDLKKAIIDKNIYEFTGGINLNDTNLDFNVSEDALINANLTGQGIVSNVSNNEVEFTNVKDFNGSLIADKGNVKLTDESINTKASVLSNNGNKIILNTNKNIEYITTNITSDKVEKIGEKTLTIDEAFFNNVNNLDVLKGSINLKSGENTNKFNVLLNEETNLNLKGKIKSDYTIKGVGTLNNDTNETIEFTKEIEEFKGKLVANLGNIMLTDESINTKASVSSNNGNKIILNTNKDIEHITTNITSDKVEKIGEKALTIDEAFFNNVNNLDVLKGSINLKSGENTNKFNVLLNEETKLNLKGKIKSDYTIKGVGTLNNDTNETIEFTKEIEEFKGKLVANLGNIMLTDESINTKASVLSNNGNRIILNTNKYINTDLVNIESKNIVKKGEADLEINKNILDDNYTVDIQNGTLIINDNNIKLRNSLGKSSINVGSNLEIINSEYRYINSNLTGSGNIYLKNGVTEFNDIDTFNGNIFSDDTIIFVDDKINVKNSKINTKNVIFKTNKDINYLTDKISADKLIKAGDKNLIINDNNFSDIENIEGKIEFNKDVKLDNLNNLSIVNIKNNVLNSTNYTGNGLLQVDINDEDKFRIITEKSNSDLRLELNNIDFKKLKNQEIKIGKSSNNIVVTNLDYLNRDRLIKANLNKNDNIYTLNVKLESIDLGLINLVKEIYDVNNFNNYKVYRDNAINAEFIVSHKNEYEYKKHLIYNDVFYKNTTTVYGANINYSKSFDINKFKITPVISAKLVDINTKTSIKNSVQDYNKNIINTTFDFILNGNYKFINSYVKLGVNSAFFKEDNEIYKLVTLNNEYNFNVSPNWKINEKLDITYINEANIKYQPVIYQNLLNPNKDTIKKIDVNTPLIYSYRTGLKFETKYVDFDITGKIGYNQTNITATSLNDTLSHDSINRLYLEGDMNLIFKINSSVNINLNGSINNESNTGKFKLGIDYKF